MSFKNIPRKHIKNWCHARGIVTCRRYKPRKQKSFIILCIKKINLIIRLTKVHKVIRKMHKKWDLFLCKFKQYYAKVRYIRCIWYAKNWRKHYMMFTGNFQIRKIQTNPSIQCESANQNAQAFRWQIEDTIFAIKDEKWIRNFQLSSNFHIHRN